MPEHYTLDTTEAPHWCNACGRITQHSVSGGRLGRCLEHEFRGAEGTGMTRAQFARRKKQEQEKQNPSLFAGEQ